MNGLATMEKEAIAQIEEILSKFKSEQRVSILKEIKYCPKCGDDDCCRWCDYDSVIDPD